MSMLFTEFLLIQNALNDNFQSSLTVTHFASDFGIQWIRSYSLKQLAIEGSKKSQISQNNKSLNIYLLFIVVKPRTYVIGHRYYMQRISIFSL